MTHATTLYVLSLVLSGAPASTRPTAEITVGATAGIASLEQSTLCPAMALYQCPSGAATGAVGQLSISLMAAWEPIRLGARVEGSVLPGHRAMQPQVGLLAAVRYDRTLIAEINGGPAITWLRNGSTSTALSWLVGGSAGVRLTESAALLVRAALYLPTDHQFAGGYLGAGVEVKI